MRTFTFRSIEYRNIVLLQYNDVPGVIRNIIHADPITSHGAPC